MCLTLSRVIATITTTFARSDASATIYSIMHYCAASNWEWHLLNSLLLVKFFVNGRALRKINFIRLAKNCNAVTWFWSKRSSLRVAFIKLTVIGKIFREWKGFEKNQFYKTSKELWCDDFVLKQTFQLLDQPPFCTTMHATVTNSKLEESPWSLRRCW